MVDYKSIIVDREGGVLVLTFNRPEKLNALTHSLALEALEVVEQANVDDSVKVLVITGAGRGFGSGADLDRPAPGDPPRPAVTRRAKVTPLEYVGRLCLAIANCSKPTIGAINGVCAGGSFGMILGADMRIASEQARFSAIFVRRGLHPDCGVTYHLPRLVGPSKALELCMTGETVDAYKAERLGIVNKVVPHEQLMPATMELANQLAKSPSLVLELAKQAIHHSYHADLAAQLGFEAWCLSVCHRSADAKEGVKAFLEKREPVYRGE